MRGDRDRIVEDLFEHLQEFSPEIVRAYPEGYLLMILHDSIRNAEEFGLRDVVALRAFVDLRWRMAAGWYLEPSLAEVLRDPLLDDQRKFDRLGKDDFADAWLNAVNSFDSPEHWRGHLWKNQT